MKSSIRLGTMIALFASLGIAQADKEAPATDDQSEAVVAAHLLFGEGLTIERSAGHVKIAYDPASGLDDARVKQLIDTYWKPRLYQLLASYFYSNSFQINRVNYASARDAGGEAFLFMEPGLRAGLCIDIADQHFGGDKREELENWCAFQAARTARYSLHEFRGQPIDSPASKPYYGTLQPADKLPEDGFVVFVPGAELPVDLDLHFMRVQQNMLGAIHKDSHFYGAAMKLKAESDKWFTKQRALVMALNKKQAGKGSKIIWGERFFTDIDPVPAVTRIDSCANVYWAGFATPKFKKNALFNWEMSVDGEICHSDYFQDFWQVFEGPFYDSFAPTKYCSPALVAPGPHTVSVKLWSMKAEKTGNKVIDFSGDHAVLQEQYADLKDKVVAKGSLTCTSPDGLGAGN